MPTEREWVDPKTGEVFAVRNYTIGQQLRGSMRGGWLAMVNINGAFEWGMGANESLPAPLIRWFLSVVDEGSKGDDSMG